MSHYIERLCPAHGEWQMDTDNPGDCPQCPDVYAERDRLAAEVAALREKLTAERDRFVIASGERDDLFSRLERTLAERDAALRERDEARAALSAEGAKSANYGDAREASARRWAAEQVRKWWARLGLYEAMDTFTLADRIERGPQPGEEG